MDAHTCVTTLCSSTSLSLSSMVAEGGRMWIGDPCSVKVKSVSLVLTNGGSSLMGLISMTVLNRLLWNTVSLT